MKHFTTPTRIVSLLALAGLCGQALEAPVSNEAIAQLVQDYFAKQPSHALHTDIGLWRETQSW